MLGSTSLSSLAVRFVVVMFSVAAIATLVRPYPETSAAEKQPEPISAATDVSGAAPKAIWRLGVDGWFIRVDNAEIAIPTFAEQVRMHRRGPRKESFSPFDDLIVRHASAQGFDWRLVAAVIFEESKFDPDSESDRGAVGLMQVRPIAAEAVGEASSKDPDDNIRTGVLYLHQLDKMFADAAGDDRLCLVLAAYNIGPGHIHDAQQLARRFGLDPNRWEDGIARVLPLLEQPAINKDLPNGFAQGRATIGYVNRILDRYDRYQAEAPSLYEVGADSGAAPG
ncbi:MAG: transglycosylase SLT domain-containing protein [Deltaproteobacteria bacterium]|nr:transglycosylase SLT domain-containing protein [Deltaproteobacteria bacterium]